jgi:dUTP pyrophosphatase
MAAVPTGVHLAIPIGWVGLVRDRSSVALKGGVTAAGVIDAGYRGEVKVIMHNLGTEPLVFNPGDRIAQCVILQHFIGEDVVEAKELDSLGNTARGQNGFGSTGV